jgi:N-sulfoglucosamine sulfohydrolase
MKKPNILYIHSHDTGRFIQPHGVAIETPNLQRLAEEGVLFRKAFCAAPTCSPSRACLLTGMAAHSSGMFGLAHLGWRLNDYKQHLIHTLHEAGYTSALSGIQHIAHPPVAKPEDIGYHEILPVAGKGAKETTDCAVEYLSRDHEKPFFLSVGFFETHREFPPVDERDDPRYIAVAPPLPDTPENRADMAAYRTSARILDNSIGRILKALKEKRLDADTLVICTTDHGLAMPNMKCSLTDHGTGVFLILRGPAGFDGGRVEDAMVSHLDLFPTVCDVAGIEKPERLQGKSLLPLVSGETDELHEELFAEVTYHAAYEPKRSVRTKRWKYIRRFDRNFKKVVLPNCDDGPPKFLWLEKTEWKESCPGEQQLYDLLLDPQENCNLAAVPDHAGVLNEMQERLQRWMERTDDPLLKGDVEVPEAGMMWPQDAEVLTGPVFGRDGSLRELPDI